MKEQASQILQDKIKDICEKIPAFGREIDWGRGKTRVGKDFCHYEFKNGSVIENLAARESSRGRRFHAKTKLAWLNCGIKQEDWNVNLNRRLY